MIAMLEARALVWCCQQTNSYDQITMQVNLYDFRLRWSRLRQAECRCLQGALELALHQPIANPVSLRSRTPVRRIHCMK